MRSFNWKNEKSEGRELIEERKKIKNEGPAWLDVGFDEIMKCGTGRAPLDRTRCPGFELVAKKRTSFCRTLGMNESGIRRGQRVKTCIDTSSKYLKASEVYSNAFVSTCSDITAPEFEKCEIAKNQDFDNLSQLNDAFDIENLDVVFVNNEEFENESFTVAKVNENFFDEEFCDSELIDSDSSITDNLRRIMKNERNHEVFLKLTSVIKDLQFSLDKPGLEKDLIGDEKNGKFEGGENNLESGPVCDLNTGSKRKMQVCCGGCNLF